MTDPSTLERYKQLAKEQHENQSRVMHELGREDERLDEMDLLWDRLTMEEREEARGYIVGLQGKT